MIFFLFKKKFAFVHHSARCAVHQPHEAQMPTSALEKKPLMSKQNIRQGSKGATSTEKDFKKYINYRAAFIAHSFSKYVDCFGSFRFEPRGATSLFGNDTRHVRLERLSAELPHPSGLRHRGRNKYMNTYVYKQIRQP